MKIDTSIFLKGDNLYELNKLIKIVFYNRMKHDLILISVLLFFIIWLEAKKYMLREEFEDFNFSDTWNGLYSMSTIAYWVFMLAIFGPMVYVAFIPPL